MGDLIPGEAIIYEKVGTKIYAKYRDKSEIPRWVVGLNVNEDLPSWADWLEMIELSEENPILRQHLEKALTIYYMVKSNKNV